MAYPIIGVDGAVTSWINGIYATIIAGLSPNSATLNIFADDFDVTGLGVSPTTSLSGLRSSSGNISGRINFGSTPRIGSQGLVTFASGYVVHCYAWTVDIQTTAVHDITEYNATEPGWKTFRPDRNVARGTFTCRVDNSTDISLPQAANAVGAAIVLKWGENTSDERLEFNAVVTVAAVRIVTPGVQEVTYSFVSSGTITPYGTAGILGTSATPLAVPTWNYDTGSLVSHLLTLTSRTGQVFTVEAFYTRISISCNISQPLEISIDYQGNGEVAIA